VPSAGGRLPGLEGLECERTPEVRIITADEERMRCANWEKTQEREEAESTRDSSFEYEWQRRAERDCEAEYAQQQEYQHER